MWDSGREKGMKEEREEEEGSASKSTEAEVVHFRDSTPE